MGGVGVKGSMLLDRRRGGRRCWQLVGTSLRTVILILIYYVFSIGLTFYQKHLFKDFPFPLTVVIVHLIIKFLLAGVCRFLRSGVTTQPRPILPWRVYITRVFPAGAAAGIDIGLSQWSLEFITVTLYTMSKSTAILFILIFAIIFKLEEMRWSVVMLVLLIAGGLLMFTYKYTQFNLFGFLLVLTASLLSGLRWTLSQMLMQKSELGLSHPVDLVYHIQPWMALSLLPLAAIIEGVSLAGAEMGFNYKKLDVVAVMWGRVLLGALIAFCMEISEYYVVSFTSSLTFSISGVAKEVTTLSLAVHFYHETLTTINKLGLLVCLLGISLHVFIKTFHSPAPPTKGGSTCSTPSSSGGDVDPLLPSTTSTTTLLEDASEDEDEVFSR